MHAPLFTAPVLLIEQPRHLYATEGHYEVLDESGRPLAYVNEHMNARSHRRGPHRPHRFTVYDTGGHPLLTLDKPWDRGRPHIQVTGPHGEPYGGIVQDRAFAGSRFRLCDPRGHTVAEIRGDWKGWDFTLLDRAGIEIARVGKEHPGLLGGFFTTEDRYALEFAYDLPWPLRRLVLAAALTIDVLLHEREPEFYHSHYADFRRYPEYGYRPRHHWHHPRRGYMVARRRRPPLLVHHTFRPVRRRGYVPVRERAVESRGGYRTFSSRSEAPSRSTGAGRAATPRVDRRGGGGFASRSEAAPRRSSGFASRSEAAAPRRDRTSGASRSESPASGASARRERQRRSGAARQSASGKRVGAGRQGTAAKSAGSPRGGGSSNRVGGLFGGGSSGSRSSSGSSARSSSSRGGASRSSFSKAASKRSGGFSSRSSGGRSSGGASRSSRSSGRSSGGRSSGGSSRRNR
ncbi:phospholipid scramblase-related protein [Nocardiopsis alba]|uniref:LURP-one-related/scramblase family protein n=1 Tax=Nocardiopsis alba TaxID=53437 RepID=UPI00366C3349